MTFIRSAFELYQYAGQRKAGFRAASLAFMELERYIYRN